MLGIRYINNTAVDLWVGDSESFCVDEMLVYQNQVDVLVESLKKADFSKLRHLGIVFENPDNASCLNLFETLQSYCGFFPQRITIILKSLVEYEMVQKVMFSTLLKRS